MSGVKNGDRVRMTLGENAVVGTADLVTPDGLYLSLDACQIALYLDTNDWSTEVIAPPIPDVVGTIVLDRDGDAWQRYRDGWCTTRKDVFCSLTELQEYGLSGFLWTPGATS